MVTARLRIVVATSFDARGTLVHHDRNGCFVRHVTGQEVLDSVAEGIDTAESNTCRVGYNARRIDPTVPKAGKLVMTMVRGSICESMSESLAKTSSSCDCPTGTVNRSLTAVGASSIPLITTENGRLWTESASQVTDLVNKAIGNALARGQLLESSDIAWVVADRTIFVDGHRTPCSLVDRTTTA